MSLPCAPVVLSFFLGQEWFHSWFFVLSWVWSKIHAQELGSQASFDIEVYRGCVFMSCTGSRGVPLFSKPQGVKAMIKETNAEHGFEHGVYPEMLIVLDITLFSNPYYLESTAT